MSDTIILPTPRRYQHHELSEAQRAQHIRPGEHRTVLESDDSTRQMWADLQPTDMWAAVGPDDVDPDTDGADPTCNQTWQLQLTAYPDDDDNDDDIDDDNTRSPLIKPRMRRRRLTSRHYDFQREKFTRYQLQRIHIRKKYHNTPKP